MGVSLDRRLGEVVSLRHREEEVDLRLEEVVDLYLEAVVVVLRREVMVARQVVEEDRLLLVQGEPVEHHQLQEEHLVPAAHLEQKHLVAMVVQLDRLQVVEEGLRLEAKVELEHPHRLEEVANHRQVVVVFLVDRVERQGPLVLQVLEVPQQQGISHRLYIAQSTPLTL